MGEGWCGTCQQLVRQGKKLPAERTGTDLPTEGPSLGHLNSCPYRHSLLGVDFPMNCEMSLSPLSLGLSPSSSSLPDLIGHPGGRGVVSRMSGNRWGVAVKQTTKSISVDIDKMLEI